MKKPDQCKGCKYLHNAGHKENKAMFKYNIWCAIASKPANKATGECKLNGWRKLGERYETIRSATKNVDQD